MSKDRNSKVIAIIALVVGVVALSVGFAAYSSQLVIKSSADVKPNKADFNVDFSKSSTSVVAGEVTGEPTGTATAGPATIDNSQDDSTIKNLSATFTEPGQKVTYNFYAYNAGKYAAFLNNVIFANAQDANGNDLGKFKVCTPGTGTDADKVAAACENISVKVTVGTDEFTGSTNVTSTHELAISNSDTVKVEIEYTGTARADGDFSVAFGDITLAYESVD